MEEEKNKKMTRNDVIAKICDPSTRLNDEDKKKLTRGYIDCTEGTGFMGKYLYGVNVRTPNDLSNVEPYFAASDYASISPITKRLPDFTDEFGIREMFFYADLDEESKPISILIHSILFDTKTEDVKNEQIIKTKIIDWLKSEGSFFTANVKNLSIRSSRAYMWLSSEDFFTGASKDMQDYWVTSDNPNGKKNGQALSNILAISDDREFLQNQIVSRRIELLNFLILLKARHLFEQNLQRLRASEKSAKAAIMSRNMSHNLGSHVMAYLKQHLYSVQDMIKDNILEQILSPEDTIESIIQGNVNGWLEKVKTRIQNNDDNIQEIAMPFLVGLGKFISYLQERQDFIATIATDYNPYFSTVNFKDFIYDELNPDLRYERHKDRSGMRPDNILLGNIAKSEGLARVTRPTQSKKDTMSDIILKFRHFDGSSVFDFDGHTILEGREEAAKSLEQMRDVELSLPGGVVGRQAFFSIIENIIRNAAKHGKWGEKAGSTKRDLILTFDYYKEIKDFSHANEKDQLVTYLWTKNNKCRPVYGELDTRSFLKTYYSCASDILELGVFTITDNMWFELVPTKETFNRYKNNPKVLERLVQLSKRNNLIGMRAALCQRYIDKDGKMINENKGIKEMRISAAWMRSLEDSLRFNPFFKNEDPEIDDHDYKSYYNEQNRWTGKTPVLLARAVAQLDNNKKKAVVKTTIKVDSVEYEIDAVPYNLQMIFCLMKPKKIAIVSDRRTFSESFRRQLREVSWAAFSSTEYRNPNNKNRSYEFIIIDDSFEKAKDEADNVSFHHKIRCISHSRTFKLSLLPRKLQNRISRIIDKEVFDRELLDFVEIEMYKTLACYNSKTDFIRISDDKTFAKYEEKSGLKHSSIITITNGESRDEQGALCKFIYRKHHENDEDFNTFMTESPEIDLFTGLNGDTNPNVVTFVEGITGNNSTDRLVRNELLSDRWAYAHLHAMKQKIAIFDERIFAKVYRKDEMDIINHNMSSEPFVPFTEDNMLDALEEYSNILPNDVILATSDAEMLNNLNSFLERRYSMSQKCIRADKIGFADAMKGVYVFTIIKTTSSLDIYGFVCHDSDGSNYYSLIGKIGNISLDTNKNVQVTFTEEGRSYLWKFDRISIHQGLLDKVYEFLGFKGDFIKKKKDVVKKLKESVTNALYEKLSVDRGAGIQTFYKEDNQVDGTFLPHLMIHSGRSKPSASDMPQHQPFIQYAAIEHAVLDCKYSLVELMDFARFEQYED